MAGKGKGCCAPGAGKAAAESCRVEAVVPVDERGQMVLPKGLRDRAGIKAGDKLAVALWEKDGKVCCITLVKADELVDLLKSRLGPVIKEML